eukprot:SAG31_NODE_4034_length_3647_cov_26.004510_5_plen_100_part_00
MGTADNVYLEEGALVLRSKREKSGRYNYTSGAVQTQGKVSWAHPGGTRGKGCYFLVFVQLFEKYGTLIERNTALIEKVAPCSVCASKAPRRTRRYWSSG